MSRNLRACGLLAAVFVPLLLPASLRAETVRKSVSVGGRHIALELVDDRVLHFQIGHQAIGASILRSPMVLDEKAANLSGPSTARLSVEGIQGPQMQVSVDATGSCITVHRPNAAQAQTRLCLRPHGHLGTTLAIDPLGAQNLYGLGEQFNDPGVSNGDWLGRWRAGGPYGNDMVAFSGGYAGNAQFPVLYALGAGKQTFALLIDEPRKVSWDFTHDPFLVSSPTDTLRGYIVLGDDLPAVRRQVMALVGRPLVPPKPAFGLWISKYGYRSWEEVRQEVVALRQANIPVDGVVLDLFWFGGVDDGGHKTQMGTLRWDPNHFATPKAHMDALKKELGVEVMVIEESYIGQQLAEHKTLADQNMLVTLCKDHSPAPVVNDSIGSDRTNPKDMWFWGDGGMLDWTQAKTRDYWHDTKRAPLVEAGVAGFWTDLAEPRMFNADGCYEGLGGLMPSPAHQEDVHNIYALLWHQGIAEGMARKAQSSAGIGPRPFILSRSGTLGIQRYGAAMWSGDIGSNMAALSAHMNAQMHLGLSGVDYFGTDIGGFWRSGLDSDDVGALFSTWLANSVLLDVPVRPHTLDTRNLRTTNPAKLGDVAGNREALRLRYALVPYLYSQAHRAAKTGDAVFPPLVYHFQDDANVRLLGSEKMLGASLLMTTLTQYDSPTVSVYLPRGTWIDWHTGTFVDSQGGWVHDVPAATGGHVRLPLYARAGSLVPLAADENGLLNTLGRRADGSTNTTLRVRVFADTAAHASELYEDDFVSTAYQQGQLRETPLAYAPLPQGGSEVTVGAAQGSYPGAPARRPLQIELVGRTPSQKVVVDGKPVRRCKSAAACGKQADGWWTLAGNQTVVRLQSRPVHAATVVQLYGR